MNSEHITTTVIGSMPKPVWLVPEDNIRLWRLSGGLLAEAQDDATRLAIRDQELAGVEVISDGEQRRMYYMSRFISALSGVSAERSNLANVSENTCDDAKPRVVGPLGRKEAFSIQDLMFLKAHTHRRTKITLPGPMTVVKVMQDEHYRDERAFALAVAAVLREEVSDLQNAGCDVIQLDEAFAIYHPQDFQAWGREALDAALEGIQATTCVHFCFGYRPASEHPPERDPELVAQFRSILPEIAACRAKQLAFECAGSKIGPKMLSILPPGKQVIYGVVNNACTIVEDPVDIATRLREARDVLGPGRLWAAPDCGLVWLPARVARAKLKALVLGARLASLLNT